MTAPLGCRIQLDGDGNDCADRPVRTDPLGPGAHMSRTLRIRWNATGSHYLTGFVTNTLIIRKIEASECHKFEAEDCFGSGYRSVPPLHTTLCGSE